MRCPHGLLMNDIGPQRGPASLPRILAQVKQDGAELERAGTQAKRKTVDEVGEVFQPQEGSPNDSATSAPREV